MLVTYQRRRCSYQLVGLAVSVRDSVVLETVPPVGGIYESAFVMSYFDKNKSFIKQLRN